ncbi:MAG TPA: CvpA family protein [Chloroflexota bacterium]|nr:CvpA family protein [Chloroflexota bacterium]
MNAVDIAIIVILALGFLSGIARGFIVEVASIVGLALGVIIARADYTLPRQLLAHVIPHSPWLTPISYAIVLFIVWAAVLVVAGRLRSLARMLFLGGLDRLAGGLLGLLQAVVFLQVLLVLATRVHNKALHHAVAHSQLGQPFLHLVPYLNHFVPHIP